MKTDRELLLLLLSSGLTEQQTEHFGGQLAQIELFNRKLSPVLRRHAEAIARAKKLIGDKPDYRKGKEEQRTEWHRHDDPYSAKVTPGTAIAEKVLSCRPLAPPIRRKVG